MLTMTNLIFISLPILSIFNINLITCQPAPPATPPAQPHWCPPNAPYKGGTVIGPYGQDCTPSQGDCPAACPVGEAGKPHYQGLKSVAGTISCGVNFDCCSCLIMECIDCIELNCNGDSGCFGAKNIQIQGASLPTSHGAAIICNGDLSCKETIIQGTNIDSIGCTGDQSCQYARMYLTCMTDTGCILQCVGDNSCSSNPSLGLNAVFQLTNSNGISCSANACRFGYFNLKQNIGGFLSCGAYGACEGSTIIVDQNIASMSCNGLDACRGAAVYITNPENGFSLLCGAAFACEGLQIYITVNDPSITALGSISCGAASACANMQVMIITQQQLPPKPSYPATQTLTVASLSCGAPSACANVVVQKSANVKFESCFCSTSALATDITCAGLRGLGSQCSAGAV